MSEHYKFLFNFEKNWDHHAGMGFFEHYWSLSLLLSAVYMLGIYLGQKWMTNRPEYQLKSLLIIWNGLVAIFSIAGTIRFAPHFFGTLGKYGFVYSVCTMDYRKQASGFWICMFGFSKVAEFGDTVFLVLRKRKVIFLHWYHHITVLIYTWHALGVPTGSGRWFVQVNYAVHSLMYTYYALSAWGQRFPKWLRMSITLSQLVQMVMGALVSFVVFWHQITGQHCDATHTNTYMALAMYISYLGLFCHFFYTAYIAPDISRTNGMKKAD